MIALDIGLAGLSLYLYRKTKQCAFTGLLNKQQFNVDAKKMRRADDIVIIIDINKFKQINDNLGHKRGDEIIEELSKCIKKNIRFSDRAYRIGGDEFAIITNYPELGQRIKDNANISVSVGIGKTYEEADKDMYRNKKYVSKV